MLYFFVLQIVLQIRNLVMITLRLDEHMEQELNRLAAQMGTNRSVLIRKSIQQFIDQQKQVSAWELGQDLFGKHASGQGNLAKDRKALLKQKLTQKRAKKS